MGKKHVHTQNGSPKATRSSVSALWTRLTQAKGWLPKNTNFFY